VLSFLQEQFEILHEIGSGGMGKVYLARHKKLNRSVALKILLQSGDVQQRRRFLQEAEAASALNHPNIVVIYDVLSSDGADVIVMEYIAGKTLVDAIPRSGLRVPQTIKYGLQISDALAAAHAAGIVHRDLKPANIMVTDRGHIKILDFGLAKLSNLHAIEDAETAALGPLTVQGSIVGTLSYMSPEQAQGKLVDARSDIFSLGSVLYEMATGERAFTGDNSISILSAVLRDDPRSIKERTTDSSDGLEQLIRRCLRKDPADRWQTMDDVRQALEELKEPSATSEANRTAAMTSAVLPLPEPSVAPAPRSRRSRDAALAAVALLAVVAAAGTWWLASRSPELSTVAIAETPVKAPEPSRTSPAVDSQAAQTIGSPRVPAAIPPIVPPPPKADLAAPPPPVATNITVPDGLPMIVTLANDVPADAEPQTPLTFTVERDVAVAGKVVIPKGSTARGVILNRTKRKLLIIGSKVLFQFIDVAAVNGAPIRLRATRAAAESDDDSGRPLERSGGGNRPKNVVAPKGTQLTAYVAGEHQLSLKN
jgi:serine/threonine protein kinase